MKRNLAFRVRTVKLRLRWTRCVRVTRMIVKFLQTDNYEERDVDIKIMLK